MGGGGGGTSLGRSSGGGNGGASLGPPSGSNRPVLADALSDTGRGTSSGGMTTGEAFDTGGGTLVVCNFLYYFLTRHDNL